MTDPTREKMVTALRDALAQGPMRERAMDALEDDLLYEAKRITDILLAKGVPLPEPPAPAAPPRPTWTPGHQAADMLFRWREERDSPLTDAFLRRLYAHLHRDRVAALPVPRVSTPRRPGTWTDDPTIAVIRASKEQVSVARTMLLALADDGNGA